MYIRMLLAGIVALTVAAPLVAAPPKAHARAKAPAGQRTVTLHLAGMH